MTSRHALRRKQEVALRVTKKRWVQIASASLITAVLAVGTVTAAQSATPTVELLVNSLEQTTDAKPGDGVCADTTGACTLRAAIQESNMLNKAPGEVSIGVANGFAGGNIPISGTKSTWMRTTAVSSGGSIGGDGGAVFSVTAPVSIDLNHKITAATTLDSVPAALFYLNGDSITLSGIDNSHSSETTFYVGPNASNVTITDGADSTQNYYAERFFVVRGGAKNVTFSNYTVQGYAANNSEWGWGWVDGATATPVDGLTVDHMTYNVTAGASGCGGGTAVGCSSTPIDLAGQKVNKLEFTNNAVKNLNRTNTTYSRVLNLQSATVDDLKVEGNTITAPRVGETQHALIDMGASARVGSVTITGNAFTGVAAVGDESNGLIRFPVDRAITGDGLIADNVFTTQGRNASGTHAIYWNGPYSDAVNVTDSHLAIKDNRFDGFGGGNTSTVRMYQTGAVTMERNTFETNTTAQSDTTREEGAASGSFDSTMVNNFSYGANGKLNTWFPTARTSANVQAAPLTAAKCSVDMEIAPPDDASNTDDLTGARYPAYPARVDVYWTAGNSAEAFLESVDVDSAKKQTINVNLPMPGDERLASLPDGAELPVDPVTGAVSGGLRLQTQDPNAGVTAASSQYSRVAAIDGSCRPELTIDQADGQNDFTMGRDLHYTITSTMSLEPDTVAPNDVAVRASATAATIDATKLNPRVVSVAPIDGSEDTKFDVVVRVDDSALVTVTMGPDAVSNHVGFTNVGPATSTDNEITFVNPLTVSPSKMTVVTGDSKGKDYTLAIRSGAPVPTDSVKFTTTIDAAGKQHGVKVSPTAPSIGGGAAKTEKIKVTAAAGDVSANTPAGIAHTAASKDSNYDGLVVPSLSISLFSTDPAIQITKQAYTDATDTSSPASIQASGTEAPKDSRLLDGQNICFVYTVKNISEDDWATKLSNVVVTDSDTRLGENGVIGTIPQISVGGSTQLSACGTIIPIDTTTGDDR